MRFLSCFSGVEAASVAWKPLGWECVGVAEVEPFPCAVLAHHYPDVPNLGDVTQITEAQITALGCIDLIVGGFPCQDLSIAGKRKGMHNHDGSPTRSGLFFDAMRLVRFAREHCGLRWLVIENVPGLYSSNDGLDFAALVSEMAGCGFGVPSSGWGNTGVAAGPLGKVEWATLDAQWFGLAQRRKRVFIVADFGDWTRSGPVLLIPESLQGHSPPRREAREGTTGTLEASLGRSRGAGTPTAAIGRGWWDDSDVGATIRATDSVTKADTLVTAVAPPITSNPYGDLDNDTYVVAHSLRAEGFDAGEDGTGRGTPLIATTLRARDGAKGVDSDCTDTLVAIPLLEIGKGTSCAPNGLGIGQDGDPMFTLQAGAQHGVAVAFQTRGSNVDLGQDVTGTTGSNADRASGSAPCVAWSIMPQNSGRDYKARQVDVAQPVMAGGPVGGNQGGDYIQNAAAVRRLTPEECEALQGFPRLYTRIPYGKKGPGSGWSADGPRYRALGNSFAVPVVRWLGERIATQEALSAAEAQRQQGEAA